jgi:hypothetical protein
MYVSAIAFADAEKAIINTNPLLYEEKKDHLTFTMTRNPPQSGERCC